MTARWIDTGGGVSLAQILFDPLSYIHPQRLRLPSSLNTPRQRALVNRMLLEDAPDANHLRQQIGAHPHRLLRHWARLPYICSLVGSQLLKSDLARGGRSLRLPAPVRFFMSLPLQQIIAAEENGSDAAGARGAPDGADALMQVLGAGLPRILDWQRQAPAALLDRMRLLFPAQLDACFEEARNPMRAADLFLISQAIQYAKNHPYHM